VKRKMLGQLLIVLSMVILILPLQSSTFIAPVSAQGSTIKLAITPDFYFAQELGEEFDINVTISNVNETLHLIGIHFRLLYDDELLSVVNVREGNFLSQYGSTYFAWNLEEDGFYGGPHVVVGNMILPNSTGQWPGPFPEGDGVVATIRFKVIYRPVEPDPIEACVLRFAEVILLDDQGNNITDYTTGISLYQSPVPMLYPEPSFTFTPAFPVAGQTVLFNASESVDPDGNITEYTWDFKDGTILTTNETVVTHIFTQPKVYNVTLFVTDDQGLQSNVTVPVEVGVYTPVEIEIASGELYHAGEIAEFYISTSQLGKPVNVTFTELLLYFNGSQYANLSSMVQPVAEGFYMVKCTIPSDAPSGVYALYVKTECSGITAVATSSFQVSNILADIDATLVALDGKVAYINSTLGIIQKDISDINLTVIEVKDHLVVLDSTLGSIKGTIESIDGNVVTIKTDIGTVELDISDIKGATTAVSTTLYATLAFAIISAIAAIIAVLLIRKR